MIFFNLLILSWQLQKFTKKKLSQFPLVGPPFNRKPSPSDTNCQGTEFLFYYVLCFTCIAGQSRYRTMTAKFQEQESKMHSNISR